eukprot:COSAG02_NODE_1350_length_13120_cov_4.275555_12_plen_200_part_00
MPAPELDNAALESWMAAVQSERFGEPAPVNIVNAVRASCTSDSFAAGVQIEAENMAPLMGSPEAFALRHLFFSERAFLRGGESAIPVQTLIDSVTNQPRFHATPTIPVGASEEKIEQLLFPAVQDAMQLLAESPSTAPDDIDVAYTQGLGFPRYLGGPIWWAKSLGLERLRGGLERQGVAVIPMLAGAVKFEDVLKPKL